MIIESINDINQDELTNFTCGINQLDYFLKSYALLNNQTGYGKTFVLEDNKEIIGFFTLCSAQVKFGNFPNPAKEALPKYPIPCIRIARLAVAKKHQNKGYGKELLRQAFLKIVAVSFTVGVKLVLVDAKETSKTFYEKYDFKPLIGNTLTYYLPVETILEAIKSA